MIKPPPRFSRRAFTLAYVTGVVGDSAANAPVPRLVLVHQVGRRRQSFDLGACDTAWRVHRWRGFDGLTECLLMARECENVPLAAWELYEPPRGVKLYARTDPRWVRRRHRIVREEFMSLRYQVRQSNRQIVAMARLRQDRPAT